jgi:hypothetical protein
MNRARGTEKLLIGKVWDERILNDVYKQLDIVLISLSHSYSYSFCLVLKEKDNVIIVLFCFALLC